MTDKNDDIEIELDGDDELEIEIQDDTPEPDKGKPKAPEVETESKSAGADDDDLEGYSESVKKRINKLKFDQHAERRAKEEAVRLREEAISYAEKIRKENEELRRAYAEGESVLVNQTKARLESDLTRAKSEYKAAYEAGDADAVLAAQEKLIKLQTEHERVSNYRPRGAPTPATQAAPAAPAAPAPAKPDERAMQWAEKNPWFMKDKAMTGFAMGVHEDLVAQGIDPKSDMYYSKIDDAVRRTFPDKFADGSTEEKAPRRQAGPVVAPAARSTKAPRKIVLTSSEAALAKRLGVPLKVFAAQKLKDMQNG
jgi:hypothetical protein